MLAVLGSALDPAACGLVDAWSSAGAALVSAKDLCTAGWVFRVSDPGSGTAVIDGNPVSVRDIRAVVTRRPAVVAEELSGIDPTDRGYLAAETNAFLVAWLTAIPCCVLNRPTPTSLSGPAWADLYWQAAAARAGVPWAADTGASSGSEAYEVLACGDRCVGARSRADVDCARRLAHAAGVQLLGVRFSGGKIGAASVRPDLSGAEAQAVVLEYLLSARRIRGR